MYASTPADKSISVRPKVPYTAYCQQYHDNSFTLQRSPIQPCTTNRHFKIASNKAQKKPKVVVITGPTAVGKTELSLLLAERLQGEIISADSVQVYRGLDVGSAKVTHTLGAQRSMWTLHGKLIVTETL